MSNDVRIARVRAYAVTPRQTPPIRYHGHMEPQQLNAEIVRVTLQNGADGEASIAPSSNARIDRHGQARR